MDNTAAHQNSISMTRLFPVSSEKLFELWTNPALIKTWFTNGFTSIFSQEELSIAIVDVNLRVNGQFKIVMEESDGTLHSINGVYKTITKPKTLVFSWVCSNSEPNLPDSMVSIHYKNTIGGTEFRLLHESLDSMESRETHEQAWTKCLNCLETVI